MLSFVALFAVVMFLVNVLFTDPPKKSNDAANRSANPRRDIDFEVRDEGPRSLNPDESVITQPDQFEAPLVRSREWLDEHWLPPGVTPSMPAPRSISLPFAQRQG